MPFYEYECQKCGYHDEVLQKISDKPLTKCPSCGKNELKKLMSAPVFRLKGSGWYETDFKSDKEQKRNLAGEDKEESKSESKPDDKKDSKSEAAKPDKSESKPAAPPKARPVKTAPVKAGARKPAAKKSKPARAAKRSRR